MEDQIECLGTECTIFLETDEEDGDTAHKAMIILKDFYRDFKNWDNKLRMYAADELTELANDWLQDDEDTGEELEAITEEIFASRIEISEFSITPEGDLTLYYSDDDMFLGHIIMINANIDGTISDADIAG